MQRPKRVLERSFILEEVWGFDFPTTANSLEVYVGYVRRKLEAEGESRLLHTVRGVGLRAAGDASVMIVDRVHESRTRCSSRSPSACRWPAASRC